MIIYLITVVFATLSYLGCLIGIKKELNLKYGKGWGKLYKEKNKESSNFMQFIVFFIPLYNIIFGLTCCFKYRTIADQTIERTRKVIGE